MGTITSFKGMHDYKVDSTLQCVVRDDNKKIGCWTAASKIENYVARNSFSYMEWVKFFLLDCLAYLPFLKQFQFKILEDKLMPVLSKKVDEVNLFVEKYYYCPYNTVQWLEDSKITCVGETHITLGHREANAKLVDTFSYDNETVFEEYDETDLKYARSSDRQLHYYPKRTDA